ncbi:hypothetical protein MVEN_02333700 [Mycena venus]|uniref:Uncharacterized protein n=1 Tax=Mycena venus TaxID=2733690 RepID=A0A8H6X434_9AGAR|nr:hypothetical protein MVEN_02333700 [Mycena venus]
MIIPPTVVLAANGFCAGPAAADVDITDADADVRHPRARIRLSVHKTCCPPYWRAIRALTTHSDRMGELAGFFKGGWRDVLTERGNEAEGKEEAPAAAAGRWREDVLVACEERRARVRGFE